MSNSLFDGGSFFAGANSSGGFVGFYDELFGGREIERRYILKGGPGTGKSTLMRRAADFASEKGYSAEKYACSSDYTSLDAVLIDGRIVILDGTAPHVVEASLAGCRDEIVNLGAFWDSRALSFMYEKIAEYTEKKAAAYRRAYRYISAYADIGDINAALLLPYFNADKASRAAERIFSGIRTGGGFSPRPALIDSVGMKGKCRFDTFERFAKRIYVLEDYFESAYLYLRRILSIAERTDTSVRVSYEPTDLSRPNAVFLVNDRVAFIVDDTGEREGTKINMKRFVSSVSDIRGELRANNKLREALMSSALDCLACAGENHFALEKIYSQCMDYDELEKYTLDFLNKLF